MQIQHLQTQADIPTAPPVEGTSVAQASATFGMFVELPPAEESVPEADATPAEITIETPDALAIADDTATAQPVAKDRPGETDRIVTIPPKTRAMGDADATPQPVVSAAVAGAKQPETATAMPAGAGLPSATAEPEPAGVQPATAPAPSGTKDPAIAIPPTLADPAIHADIPVDMIDAEAPGLTEPVQDSPGQKASDLTRAVAATGPAPQLSAASFRQIAEMLQTRPDAPIEIALNPEELGRVRIALTQGDGGMIVTITAEQAETLELFRRNANDLRQELGAIGYGEIAFDFGQGGAGTSQTNAPMTQASDPDAPDDVLVIDLETLPRDTLDIRL